MLKGDLNVGTPAPLQAMNAGRSLFCFIFKCLSENDFLIALAIFVSEGAGVPALNVFFGLTFISTRRFFFDLEGSLLNLRREMSLKRRLSADPLRPDPFFPIFDRF